MNISGIMDYTNAYATNSSFPFAGAKNRTDGHETIKDPAASNGVSNLQRCRAAESLIFAAVAKCLQAVTWLVARGNKCIKFSQSFVMVHCPTE